MRMSKYESMEKKLILTEGKFRRLTGIKRKTFEKMVEILQGEHAQKKIQGGRPNKLCISLLTRTPRRLFAPRLPMEDVNFQNKLFVFHWQHSHNRPVLKPHFVPFSANFPPWKTCADLRKLLAMRRPINGSFEDTRLLACFHAVTTQVSHDKKFTRNWNESGF